MKEEQLTDEIDFQYIDDRINYKHEESRLMAARRDGYEYISEHIVQTYRKTQSLRETGKICADISTIAVRAVLTKCKETLRSPGGRVWSKLSKEDVDYIRNQPIVSNKIFRRIAKELGITITKRTGVETTISIETIRDVWKRKTHKEE